MGETAEKSASCLAVMEKKAHKPGGCAGIFFQLFEWNRRLTRKKLFSKKLLPPVRAKDSKKFGGEEKMLRSKIQMIVDENNRSFSKMRKSGGNSEQMRSPSLVARLMGLESMPNVHKSEKTLVLPGGEGCFDVREESLVRSPSRRKVVDVDDHNEDVVVLEKGNSGKVERNAVTRFSSEGLQFLSRSRKQHNPKLGAPLKTPRISSERSTARTSKLIDAATKILEPGLQATSKAKYAITYSKSRPYTAKNEVMADGLEADSLNVRKQSGYVASQEEESSQISGESNEDRETSLDFKNRTETQISVSLGREKIPPRAQSNKVQGRRASSVENTVSGTKKIVVSNKCLRSHDRPRVAKKLDASSFDSDNKRFCYRKDATPSHLRSAARERRASVNGQVVSSGSVTSTYGKRRNASKVAATGANGNKDADANSLKSSSPPRQKTGNFMENESEGSHRHEINQKSRSHQRKLFSDENDGRTSLQRKIPLTGDNLGLLLEQKLKELHSQEDDDLISESSAPKRTTAVIIQELLTALTAMQPAPKDDLLNSPDPGFQVKAEAERTSVRFPFHVDHLSPGSILEASFSNDSCVSSSLDGSSGFAQQVGSMDNIYDHPDMEFRDSATISGISIELLKKVSKTLCGINQAGIRLSGDSLFHAKEVLLNAELVFGNVPEELLLVPYLQEENKILINRFLFDCAIECLDSRYSNLGFKAWRSLPESMNSKLLMQDVRKWTEFAGMALDELIEWEMSHSLGKWTDFDIEAHETGTEISLSILDVLVEEIAVDLQRLGASV